MKKVIILLLMVSMIATVFVGCADKPDSEKLPSDGFGLTSEDTNGNLLRDDVELKILKYKYGKKADPDDYIVQYFGTYNDAIVLRIWAKADETPENGYRYETVAGFEFTVISGRRMLVWHNNKLHHLQEAYEFGILTIDDIKDIHAKYLKKNY